MAGGARLFSNGDARERILATTHPEQVPSVTRSSDPMGTAGDAGTMGTGGRVPGAGQGGTPSVEGGGGAPSW